MTGPLAGVRVVEVASHVFVPMAGAVLTSRVPTSSRSSTPRPAIRTRSGHGGDRPHRRPTDGGPSTASHSEAVLLELDLSWDDIGALKHRGVIL